MLVEGDRDDGNTQMTPEYLMTIDIYVKKIDKSDKNTWRTIHEEINAPYFGEVKIFPKALLDQYKNNTNKTQKIPYEIKKRI